MHHPPENVIPKVQQDINIPTRAKPTIRKLSSVLSGIIHLNLTK